MVLVLTDNAKHSKVSLKVLLAYRIKWARPVSDS